MTYEDYLAAVDSTMKRTRWRYGQTLFNVLYDMRPDISERVRATGLDPFYYEDAQDPVIRNFLLYVQAEWGDE